MRTRKYANKNELSMKIKEFGKDQIESTVKSIDESKFTTYTYTPATFQKKHIQIRLGSVEEHRGPDTNMVLIRSNSSSHGASSNAPRKKQKLTHSAPAISHQQAQAAYASQATSHDTTTASHQSHFYYGHHPQAVNQQRQAKRGLPQDQANGGRPRSSGRDVMNLADTEDDRERPAAGTTSNRDDEEEDVDFKDLCEKLTNKVVTQNEQLKRVKKENKRMKREIQALKERLGEQQGATSRDQND